MMFEWTCRIEGFWGDDLKEFCLFDQLVCFIDWIDLRSLMSFND